MIYTLIRIFIFAQLWIIFVSPLNTFISYIMCILTSTFAILLADYIADPYRDWRWLQ